MWVMRMTARISGARFFLLSILDDSKRHSSRAVSPNLELAIFSSHAQTTVPTDLRTNEAGWNFCLDVPRYWLSSLRFQLV